MIGTRRHSVPRRGRSIFGLVSVLALLALACFPILAQADSSEIQYEDAPESATGGTIPNRSGPPASKSQAQPQGGNEASNPSTKSPSAGGGSPGNKASRQSAGNGNNRGQGNPGKGHAQKKASAAQPIPSSKASTDSGGSSPLVPILIAIAVLAAISIGAVVMKQRRQRQAGDVGVSPEAS